MNEVENILVILLSPGEVKIRREQYDRPLTIGGCITTEALFPLWPVAPDILCDKETRTFIGLSYSIPKEYQQRVYYLCQELDSRYARYNNFTDRLLRLPYGSDQTHYFEVIWSNKQADTLLPSQLAEDGWYYIRQQRAEIGREPFENWADFDARNNKLAAIELRNIPKILKNFNLILPFEIDID